jgi:ABC-type phosphate transport system auxiliary subunit
LLHWKTGLLINAQVLGQLSLHEEEISQHLKNNIGYWPVQMNGNKFATGEILKKTGRNCEGADFSWLSSKVSQTLPCTHKPRETYKLTFFCVSFLLIFKWYTCCVGKSNTWLKN